MFTQTHEIPPNENVKTLHTFMGTQPKIAIANFKKP